MSTNNSNDNILQVKDPGTMGKEEPRGSNQKDKDPYAAVTVPEPRRSQLIEVIDYTMTHPIVHDGKSRDEFTLSNAARAVWNLRHKTWESTEGGYETFGALKGACYGLQKKQNDPLRYRQ